jgi:uncharacterized protein (TIGR03437 family)
LRTLYVRVGRTLYFTQDFEKWTLVSQETSSPGEVGASADGPEPSVRRFTTRNSNLLYAAGRDVWRSDDGGQNWSNLTRFQGNSLIGGRVRDLATDPSDEARVVAVTDAGVWASHDGGLSWRGLNDGLPSFPVRRVLAAPAGGRGLRVAIEAGGSAEEMEWIPGQKLGWTPSPSMVLAAEAALRADTARLLKTEVVAAFSSSDAVYAADEEGRIYSTIDRAKTWRQFAAGAGRVEEFWIDPSDARVALAATRGSEGKGPRLLRTLNGGTWWDDLTANLPEGAVWGVTADKASGAVYVATSKGVYTTTSDLRAPATATAWAQLGTLPAGEVRGVRLDDNGNQLYAAVDGFGVFATLAPHRRRIPAVVHAADYQTHAAAPGALLSVLGAKVTSGLANRSQVPVLASGDFESQIQIPFDASGQTLRLQLEGAQGRIEFGLPLRPAAPSILVDRDGAPLALDGDSGVQLDALNPARAAMRVQLLVSGLGRVQPQWPSGLPAPLENPPAVVAAVKASLDGAPVEVTRATLAPGYVGFYLVELQMPEFVNSGMSELMLETEGQQSNRIRIFVEQ